MMEHTQDRMDGRKLGEMMLSSRTAAENFRELARCFQGWQSQALLTGLSPGPREGSPLAQLDWGQGPGCCQEPGAGGVQLSSQHPRGHSPWPTPQIPARAS